MYSKEVQPGREVGHINALGSDLMELKVEIQHALDYMSGDVDE
jgi:5-(carboxyamino)imidazole ribonucleotide synthase